MTDQQNLPAFKGYNLSKQLYVLQNLQPSWVSDHTGDYRNGTIVRLISGVDNHFTAGQHFDAEFVTVCRINTERPEFLGFRKENVAPYRIEIKE